MGRKLNISQPAVINTELTPLDTSFYIEADNTTEQWYYDNTNTYMPDRQVVPLTLSPKISVYDSDSDKSYNPAFYTVAWYALEYVNGAWKETQITNAVDSESADYVLSNDNLIVKKNVGYSYGVTIKCVAQFIDPRDSSAVYTIEDSVVLSTNRDATTIAPTFEIISGDAISFNPLTRDDSRVEFEARAFLEGENVTNDIYFEWYVVEDGDTIEILAENSIAYIEGQGTNKLSVDAMYSECLTIVLYAKKDKDSQDFYPGKKMATLAWRIPKIDVKVLSENGGAVRSNIGEMSFDTIVNVRKRGVLSEDKKKEHLAFEWKTRKSNVSTETLVGWGQRAIIPNSTLINMSGNRNSLVYPHTYLLSAYKKVVYGADEITYDGNIVVARTTN